MGKTSISWTERTWNPVTGCTQIPSRNGLSGCDNCYAKRLNDTRFMVNAKSPRFGVPFETVLLHESRLRYPLSLRAPSLFFVNSLSDVFHQDIPDSFVAKMFGVMLEAQRHTFQVLTKRPERMRRLVRRIWNAAFTGDSASSVWPPHASGSYTYPPPNVWLGVSISSEEDAWRADMLRETPAAIRFLSLEPLLGPIPPSTLDGLSWVIAGGESGPGARPMDEAWVRELLAACRERGIPFFLKQFGSVWSRQHGLKGKADDPAVFPADLRVQEFPAPPGAA